MQIQGLTTKKSKLEEFKPKESELVQKKSFIPPCTNEPAKSNYKDKKKK